MTATIPVFTTNDAYDRDRASYGDSRYGVYLEQRTHMFLTCENCIAGKHHNSHLTDDPRDFLRFAFEIATSPIMAPGYITEHPRVMSATWHHDEDGRMSIRVGLAARQSPGLARFGWPDWDRRDVAGSEYWDEPYDDDRPRLYTTHTVAVPIPVSALPDPQYRTSNRVSVFPDLGTAKSALAVLCRTVNDVAGPVLADLQAGKV